MTDHVLAANSQVDVGHHAQASFLGLTWNVDTIGATAVAAVIMIGLAFALRFGVRLRD